MDKTLLQFAKELDFPKQKLYRFIKKNDIKVKKENGVMYLSDDVQTLVIQAIENNRLNNETHQNKSKTCQSVSPDALTETLTETIKMLSNQLKEKDEQIASLTNIINTQAQSINAINHKALASELLEQKEQKEEQEKKGFFNFFKK